MVYVHDTWSNFTKKRYKKKNDREKEILKTRLIRICICHP